MPFNTLGFVAFLVWVAIAYQILPRWQWRKYLLLGASCLFYAAWNPLFLLLLAGIAWLNWKLAGSMVDGESPSKNRMLLLFGVVGSLGVLGYLKYAVFLSEILAVIMKSVDALFVFPVPDIIAPIGISFYTFHALSYIVDVYHGRLKPIRSFSDFALYVGFFPQLMAGPITRATYFLPQLLKQPRVGFDDIGWGCVLFLTGLFLKVVLADGVFAPVVDQFYTDPADASAWDAWLGILAFSGQIYCDFAGYSTCAIGIALLFGLKLPENFHAPFAAIGFSDFWRRWHISLSSWLRDYLYISLGGSRSGTWLTMRNLMLTMTIGGLWHGASWMFVLWGSLHGMYLVIERLAASRQIGVGRLLSPVGRAVATFLIVTLTWIPFRAVDSTQAAGVLAALFRPGEVHVQPDNLILLIMALGGMLCFQFMNRNRRFPAFFSSIHAAFQVLWLGGTMIGIFLFSGGDARGFIYFQF